MSSDVCRVWSPAKVNLHLRVVGRRPDGYHELRTIFQTIDLADEIELRVVDADGVDLEVTGAELPTGSDNLAVRAADAFRRRWAPDLGVAMSLDKRIPIGTGLGGGSGDAASVLLGLRRLVGRPHRRRDLWSTARELGADVPYFLWGGTALGIGRGDEIVQLPDLPPRSLSLAIPEMAIPTAEIYAAIERDDAEDGGERRDTAPSIAAAVADGAVDWPLLIDAGVNDLEAAACRRHPELTTVRDNLAAHDARTVRLSGSGGAMFAVFDDDSSDEAERDVGPSARVVTVRTVTRAELGERRFIET